jgi:hypothetical protein
MNVKIATFRYWAGGRSDRNPTRTFGACRQVHVLRPIRGPMPLNLGVGDIVSRSEFDGLGERSVGFGDCFQMFSTTEATSEGYVPANRSETEPCPRSRYVSCVIEDTRALAAD